jgi:hypothetical protein
MRTGRIIRSKSFKVNTGIFCIGPILLWLIFEIQSPFVEPNIPQNGLFETMDLYSGVLGHLAEIGIIVGIVVALVFGIRAFKGKDVPEGRAVLWGFLLLLGNVLVLPFFWYLCIWKDEKTLKN